MSRVNHFDEPTTEVKAPRSTAAWLEIMWEYEYNRQTGKNQLICTKCRGSLGFYSAEWFHVEGRDEENNRYNPQFDDGNDYLRSIIKGHQCGRFTMLDAPKEVLDRAAERMKRLRKNLAEPMSFKHQQDIYKQFVMEEYDEIIKDKTFVDLDQEDQPEEPLRRLYRPGIDLCGGSKRFPTGQHCPGCKDCAHLVFENLMWVINTKNGDLKQIESQALADLMNEQRAQKINLHLEPYV